MKKFRYYNISRYRKLRYSTNKFDKNPYIVFFPGFMSDIEGKKPNSFRSFANKTQIGFLAIESILENVDWNLVDFLWQA